MGLVATVVVMAVLLSASPVGAWYTDRHPAVHNDTWGGALGLFLSWIGFGLAVAFCAWRARRMQAQDTSTVAPTSPSASAQQ